MFSVTIKQTGTVVGWYFDGLIWGWLHAWVSLHGLLPILVAFTRGLLICYCQWHSNPTSTSHRAYCNCLHFSFDLLNRLSIFPLINYWVKNMSSTAAPCRQMSYELSNSNCPTSGLGWAAEIYRHIPTVMKLKVYYNSHHLL